MRTLISIFLLFFIPTQNFSAIDYDRIMSSQLFSAIERGDNNHVYDLLSNGANPNALSQDTAQTPLQWSAYFGSAPITQLLISFKAKINLATKEGFTALHLASQQGHIEVVELLLKSGALLEKKNQDAFTALHLASFYDRVEVVEALLNAGANIESTTREKATPLHVAAQNGSLNVLQYLLENGANINAIAPSHGTALHFAVHGNKLQAVDYLLKSDIQVNQFNDTKATAFVWNGYIGNVDIARLLIEYKADPKIKNVRSFIALHTASMRGHSQLIAYLLENKIYSGEEESFNGLKAIHYAAFYGHIESLKILTQYSKDGINAKDRSGGETPLFYAVQGKQMKTVQYIMENMNPDLTLKPKSGETLLGMAKKVDAQEILKYLMQKGVRV